MIELKNVHFSHGTKEVLHDISWKAQPGEMNLIIGANGAGKSTVIRLLSGDLKPKSGEILWDGKPLQSVEKPEQFRGVLSQKHSLQFPLSVREVVELGRFPFRGNPNYLLEKKIVNDAMERFELEPFANRNIQTLSGGEQQRVHFARVWVQMESDSSAQTKMMLIDEPTTYLDLHHQWKYMKWIAEETVKRNWITIGVLHDLPMVYQIADKVALLNNGKLMSHGVPSEVLNEAVLKETFGVHTARADGLLAVKGVYSD